MRDGAVVLRAVIGDKKVAVAMVRKLMNWYKEDDHSWSLSMLLTSYLCWKQLYDVKQ